MQRVERTRVFPVIIYKRSKKTYECANAETFPCQKLPIGHFDRAVDSSESLLDETECPMDLT